jgi:hypothetical protein
MVLALLLWPALWMAAQAAAPRPLEQSLATGKPIVLVVARAPTAADLKSEAYADWAEYLNDFTSRHQGAFEVVKVKPQDLKGLFKDSTPIRENFALVLINGRRTAVLYDGMLHEPDPYRTAAEFLAGTIDQAQAAPFRPYSFKLRERR